MSAGVNNPKRSVLISVAATVAGALALAWGVWTMNSIQGETPFTAVAVSAGGLAVLFGFLMTLNFLWAMRVFARLRRGEGVLARWTVSAETLEAFREDEARRVATDGANDWRIPRVAPPEGVEVIFAEDGVLVGDSYFGLASSGIAHVRGMDTLADSPLALRFHTVMSTVRRTSSGHTFEDNFGSLRIPVAPGSNDELRRVVEHYRDVLSGVKLVKPEFWKGRIRFGLWGAGVSALAAAAGFGMNALGIEAGVVPLVLAVCGVIFAIGGLVLAYIAWNFAARQRRGW